MRNMLLIQPQSSNEPSICRPLCQKRCRHPQEEQDLGCGLNFDVKWFDFGREDLSNNPLIAARAKEVEAGLGETLEASLLVDVDDADASLVEAQA